MAANSQNVAAVEAAIGRMQEVYSRWTRQTTIAQMRQDFDAAFHAEAPPGRYEWIDVVGMTAAWVAPTGVRSDKAILYLHGGGYRIGSIESHHELICRIASASGCQVLAIDYRLAPEHRFPSAVEDAVGAFLWLRERGFAASDIAFVGDSAGGGLALACMLVLRDRKLELPGAAALMSPWTDLTASGESYVTRADVDPVHTRGMILALAKNYLSEGADPRQPLASPLFADLHGLPPLLIQAGDRETVLDDARVLAEKAAAAGVKTRFEVFDDMIHVFQMYPDIPEAHRAVGLVGAFVQHHLRLKLVPREA